MTIFNVHIYREMRLVFSGIAANSLEEAAAIARDKPTDEADDIDDCDGETFAALVDVQGDEDHLHSRGIDFEGERERKAAWKLMAALEGALYALDENMDGSGPSKETAIANGHAAIAQAEAAGISLEPAASTLLAALNAVLPYAEKEARTLEMLNSPDAEVEAGKAWKAVEQAHAVIAQANSGGLASDPAGADNAALLAGSRQIAAIWTIGDVQSVRPDLTDGQAWDVLQATERQHDASVGITWEVLRSHADWLFGEAPTSSVND